MTLYELQGSLGIGSGKYQTGSATLLTTTGISENIVRFEAGYFFSVCKYNKRTTQLGYCVSIELYTSTVSSEWGKNLSRLY